jgi:hypothetical protein
MRQVASVIKDGMVTYFVVDAEEGELTEFATVAVPVRFDAEAAVKLGFNLIAAVGLNGHRGPASSRHIITPEQARPRELPAAGEEWNGTASAVDYIRAHPGCRIAEVAAYYPATGYKAVTSAVTRAVTRRDIERRNGKLFAVGATLPAKKAAMSRRPVERRQKWDVSQEQVVDYIRAHPDCTTKAIAVDLLGEITKETRQVIGNRIAYLLAQGGPVVKVLDAAGRVTYRIEEEVVAPAD